MQFNSLKYWESTVCWKPCPLEHSNKQNKNPCPKVCVVEEEITKKQIHNKQIHTRWPLRTMEKIKRGWRVRRALQLKIGCHERLPREGDVRAKTWRPQGQEQEHSRHWAKNERKGPGTSLRFLRRDLRELCVLGRETAGAGRGGAGQQGEVEREQEAEGVRDLQATQKDSGFHYEWDGSHWSFRCS